MKYILLALTFCFAVSAASAQEVYSSTGKSMSQVKKDREKKNKPHGFDPSRIVFGGGFGLGLGDVTSISVSPIIGYRFTNKFTAGIGIGYQYLRIKGFWTVADPNDPTLQTTEPLKANTYYPSVWARYTIWKNIFAHAEYEQTFMSYTHSYNDYTQNPSPVVTEKLKDNAPALWLGAGFRRPITDRVSFIMLGLYDVIPDPKELYNGRLDIRFGINAGF